MEWELRAGKGYVVRVNERSSGALRQPTKPHRPSKALPTTRNLWSRSQFSYHVQGTRPMSYAGKESRSYRGSASTSGRLRSVNAGRSLERERSILARGQGRATIPPTASEDRKST